MAINGYSLSSAQALQNLLFRSDSHSYPAVFYVALSTAPATWSDPNPFVNGEPGPTTGYARVAVTRNTTNWTAADADTAKVTNSVEITFPESTQSWGTITAFAVFGAATGITDFSLGGNLTNPVTIGTSTIARFNIGDLQVSSVNAP